MVSKTASPKDYFPQIQTFGKPSGKANETAANCLKFENIPKTPDKIKKFRVHSNQLGKTCKHWGIADDPIPNNDMIFGITGEKKENDVISPKMLSDVESYLREKAEQVYLSSKNEPLGKSKISEQLPEFTNDPNYRFGMKTNMGEKYDILKYDQPQDEKGHHLYVFSHKDFYPGEQYKRNYKWPEGLDPKNFSFGKVIPKEELGAKGAISPVTYKPSGFNNEPQVVSKILKDFNQVTKDSVGKSKYYKLNQEAIEKNIIFGKTIKGDDHTAWDCIRGTYSKEDLEPDKNLGKSIREGWRNISKDPDRIFGAPSLRYDIAPPKVRSIADAQNYGNEPNAAQIIFPSRFAHMGVYEEDFINFKPKEKLKDILVKGDIISDSKFDEVYKFAHEKFPNEIEKCKKDYILQQRIVVPVELDGMSIDIFLKALNIY